MRRSLSAAVAAFLLSGTIFAGGILTNTNQSAMYTRMACRDATLGIDAVYYNPAGLTKLADGFHFSINNQTIGQTRTVISNYQYLNEGKYEGEVSAPIFPGIYAVYKTGKWAFSLGFNPIGGGGRAEYSKGLPSFEMGISDLVPALQNQGQNVTAYRMNAYFEGTSVPFGYQANVSYSINDMISVAIGGRYVTTKETYKGHIKDVAIEVDGQWVPAPTFFSSLSQQLTQYATSMDAMAAALQPAIDGGFGDVALSDPLLIGTLTLLGLYQEGMTNAQAQATFQGASASFTQQSAETAAKGQLLGDQEVDAEKTGSGFTPIVSVNIQPMDMLNLSLKYEHTTKLELTNKTAMDVITGIDPETGDPITMFPDGEKLRLDIPAMLSMGATLRPIDPLLISTGFHYWFDKSADWGGREKDLSSNSWEFGLGAEYNLTEKFLLSAGWIMTGVGVTDAYQSDLSHDLPTYNGWSFGLGWDILPFMQLNVGGQYVLYQNMDRNFSHDFAQSGLMVPVKETYERSNWIIGAGLNFSLASVR
jgi:long-subunit fatty acid transport protein